MWIEISLSCSTVVPSSVTTHTGGVDWNGMCNIDGAEYNLSPPTRVVWIEISVGFYLYSTTNASPPTRVVWIEMCSTQYIFINVPRHHPHGWCGLKSFLKPQRLTNMVSVTTHTGGVDWNFGLSNLYISRLLVTTHTGGVDWNFIGDTSILSYSSHHPHGWCGLKLILRKLKQRQKNCHHPHGWCGLKF